MQQRFFLKSSSSGKIALAIKCYLLDSIFSQPGTYQDCGTFCHLEVSDTGLRTETHVLFPSLIFSIAKDLCVIKAEIIPGC